MSSQAEAHERLCLADDAVCPGRDVCSAEIERLRSELSALRQAKHSRLEWWFLCLFGAASLALLPLGLFWVGQMAAEDSYLGLFVGTPASQLAVFASIAVLYGGPRWRRYLAACLFTSVSFVAMVFCSAIVGEFEFEIWFRLLPASMLIAVLCAFAARVWGRWTIVAAGQPRAPRTVSLASYFLLLGTCAVCLAGLGQIELDETDIAEMVISFVIYSTLPGVTAGIVLLTLLSAILGRSENRWKTRLVSAAILLLASVLEPIILLLLLMIEGPSSFDSEIAQAVLVYSFSSFATITLLLSLAAFWMRLLGYELVTVRDQRADYGSRAVALGGESLQPT